MGRIKEVGIIGGGACGLAAAVMLKRELPKARVTVLEAAERVGRKLAVTGNGRCNITNLQLEQGCYHGDSALAARLLERFGYREQREFFRSLGVLFCHDERGRVYPMSLQAGSVVDALRFEALELGVRLLTGTRALQVARSDGGFALETTAGGMEFCALLVAAGGSAGGKLGGEDGYAILKGLGHKIEPVFPSLVQLRTETSLVRQLKGIKVQGAVTLRSGDGARSEQGEILFCDYGISGPPVLQVSRLARGEDPRVELDLLPEMQQAHIASHLLEMARLHPERPAGELFAGFINKRLGQVLLKSCGGSPAAPAGQLGEEVVRALASAIKGLELPVTGTAGFREAQVSAGGASTAQFFENLMSKKARGLFAAGEVLNVDGDCGGYNLAFCWASAHAAAQGIAEYLREVQSC